MRKLNALLYMFLIGLVSLTACKDDDEDAGPSVAANTMNINGNTYPINFAAAVDLSGATTASDQYALVLTNTTGSFQVAIGLNTTANSTTLPTGTYAPVSTDNNAPSPNTFSYAYVATDCVEDPQNEDEYICEEEYETETIPAGRVTIARDGNVYTVDFELTFPGGEKALGNYKGSILM